MDHIREMRGLRESRQWEELIPDALGLIFGYLSLREKLLVVPRVCKAWKRVLDDQHCWQDIDIKEWSIWYGFKSGKADLMVQLLVGRGRGSVRRLSVSGLAYDSTLAFIAEKAISLEYLELWGCSTSNFVIEQCAISLAALQTLDISCCENIGAAALEAIGKNCPYLAILRRSMHREEVGNRFSQEDEAYAIAATMPKLRQLVLCYCRLTSGGVLKILLGCKNLELLDIRGCKRVWLDQDILNVKHYGLKLLGPESDDDSCETGSWNGDPGYVVSDWSEHSSTHSLDYKDDDDYPWGS